MSLRVELGAKLVDETKIVQFPFASELGAGVTISTQVCTCTVYSGTDATPSALISGSATASGSVVSQKVTAGTVGVIYDLLCTITTSDGQTLVMHGYLAVVPVLP